MFILHWVYKIMHGLREIIILYEIAILRIYLFKLSYIFLNAVRYQSTVKNLDSHVDSPSDIK